MSYLRLSAWAAVLAAALPLLPSAAAQNLRAGAPDGRTPISSLPFKIDRSGSYYLTRSLTGGVGRSGISVAADDVAIDLNGFTLTGVAGSVSGIQVVGSFRSLTVRNGGLNAWGQNGLDAVSGTDTRVAGVTANSNVAHGIVVGDRATVERCIASDNGTAGILGDDRVRVLGCIAENSSAGGIRVDENGLVEDCQVRNGGEVGILGGPLTIVRNCVSEANVGTPGFGINVVEAGKVFGSTAFGNAGSGIVMGGRSIVRDSSSHQNGAHGIQVSDASLVIDCIVNGNLDNGIFANAFSVIRGCVAHANATEGIESLESTVEACTVVGNDVGIKSNGADTIRGCVATRNASDGIRTNTAALVVGNLLRANTGNGIQTTDINNRVSDNHLVANGTGIRSLADFTTIYKNSLTLNTVDFALHPLADVGPSILAADSDFDNYPFANILQVVTPLQ